MSEIQYFDLSACNEPLVNETTDICIIGAGAIGIYLATRLTECGFNVVLVEAGSSPNTTPADAGFDVHFGRHLYPGGTIGRSFGLGGSTTRWGGLLMPHTIHDVRQGINEQNISPWSPIVNAVSEYSDQVLKRLGYSATGEFLEFPQKKLGSTYVQYQQRGIDIVASLFLPFSKKNLSFLLNERRSQRSAIRIYTGAVAQSWRLSREKGGNAHVTQLQAVTACGKILQVVAARFVVAAGAIESSRLLLELQTSTPVSPIRSTAAVGCFLADHLSVTVANIEEASRSTIRQSFVPRFSGDWMRSFRFLETNPPANEPRAFLHFIFENDNSGFLVAKEVLTALQGRRRPQLSLHQALAGVGGLIALADARYRRSRLYIAPATKMHLQLDIEQAPVRKNCITLSNEVDRYQRRSAIIHWEISEADLQNIQATATRVINKWPVAPDGSPTLIAVDNLHAGLKPHDAYHPVGVCRMGVDAEAVVDMNLKVWGMDNMWVVSTGVLPSAGTANPTFSVLCLAERLVKQFEQQVKRNLL